MRRAALLSGLLTLGVPPVHAQGSLLASRSLALASGARTVA